MAAITCGIVDGRLKLNRRLNRHQKRTFIKRIELTSPFLNSTYQIVSDPSANPSDQIFTLEKNYILYLTDSLHQKSFQERNLLLFGTKSSESIVLYLYSIRLPNL